MKKILLKRLVDLREAIVALANNLIKDPERVVRNDGNSLKEKIISDNDWQGLDELCKLLNPFARASVYMGGSQYPTLGMIYPTIQRLFRHLDQIENQLTDPFVIDTHNSLRDSVQRRWEDPNIVGWLAMLLDPCFKSLSNAPPNKRDDVINELKRRVNLSIYESHKDSVTSNPIKASDMSSFFEEEVESTPSSLDIELQIYLSIPPMPKYELTDPLYKNNNPLIWWKEHRNTLPLLAKQARIFLGIPATSVPAERLFSDAGNVLTDKRNRLSTNMVHDLLFLKENSLVMNVYTRL